MAEARRAWLEYKEKKTFRLTLEHGSAVFFNMAFNERWTHAIPATRARDGEARAEEEETETEMEEEEEEKVFQSDFARNAPRVRNDSESETGAEESLERVGVTLRRCHTVFDPERCASPNAPRWRRRDAWRSAREMADPEGAEAEWREGRASTSEITEKMAGVEFESLRV